MICRVKLRTVAVLLVLSMLGAAGSPARAAFRAPGCEVTYGDDGGVVFLAHSQDNIFQRLLVLPFPSRVPMRDLEVWTVRDDGSLGEWVWSVVCPADVPWTERITFGDVPGGCSQLLPTTGEPPVLQRGVLYGVNCSRGEAMFRLSDGALEWRQRPAGD